MSILLRLLCIALWVLAGSTALADEQPAVDPPGPDETLIYVIREGKLVGGAYGHWIAINDETVGSLRNDQHTILRVPAGVITLNIASGGTPAAAIALDYRGGDTVYLLYEVGAAEFVELDEKRAHKLIRKTDPGELVNELTPNNEQFVVLMNLSRLGFDVMEPASGTVEPDAEHGVVTIFRQKDGKKLEFGIWSDSGFIGTLGAREAVSVKLPAGSHFFMAGNLGVTQMRADVEAGKRYYAWLDYGGWIGRVRLTPFAAAEADKLDKLLSKVSYVAVGPAADSEGVRVREQAVVEYVRKVAEQASRGEVGYNLLGPDNAFP
ncbi:MAG: hypothetical protein QNJ23_08555 [Woeseiaceae bacterium]|nr:hypothetical protein [Woeseiaceae bacterium]